MANSLNNIKQELKDLIKSIKESTGLKQEQISIKAGYEAKTITQTLSGNKNVQPIIDQLRLVFKTELEGLKKSTSDNKDLALIEHVDTLQAIVNLTEANRQMSESNNKLADGHLRLISLLENANNTGTSNSVVIRLLAKALSGERYQSLKDAEAAIRKEFRTEFSKVSEERKIKDNN